MDVTVPVADAAGNVAHAHIAVTVGTFPSRESIVAAAGLSNPAALTPSSSITVTTTGAVVADLDVDGIVTIKADDVTVRNCRVRGYSSVAIVRTYPGWMRTRVEHCELEALTGPDGGAPAGVVQGGRHTYVAYCDIGGHSDGIKAETGGLYEHNHIHTYKPPGSVKHVDGVQGSGDSDFTVRRNVIDQPISAGGNSAVFAQSWNGSTNSHTYGVRVEENYLRGGNYTVYLEGGKGDNPGQWVHGYTFADNRFARDEVRYGYCRMANPGEVDSHGNVFDDDGTPVPGTAS